MILVLCKLFETDHHITSIKNDKNLDGLIWIMCCRTLSVTKIFGEVEDRTAILERRCIWASPWHVWHGRSNIFFRENYGPYFWARCALKIPVVVEESKLGKQNDNLSGIYPKYYWWADSSQSWALGHGWAAVIWAINESPHEKVVRQFSCGYERDCHSLAVDKDRTRENAGFVDHEELDLVWMVVWKQRDENSDRFCRYWWFWQ